MRRVPATAVRCVTIADRYHTEHHSCLGGLYFTSQRLTNRQKRTATSRHPTAGDVFSRLRLQFQPTSRCLSGFSLGEILFIIGQVHIQRAATDSIEPTPERRPVAMINKDRFAIVALCTGIGGLFSSTAADAWWSDSWNGGNWYDRYDRYDYGPRYWDRPYGYGYGHPYGWGGYGHPWGAWGYPGPYGYPYGIAGPGTSSKSTPPPPPPQ